MNYEYLEKTVIGNLLLDTLQYSRVDKDIIWGDSYLSLYKLGKKLNETSNDNTITRVEILSVVDGKWGEYSLSPSVLDDLYDYIDNELGPRPAKLRKQEFANAISRLNERIRVNDVRMVLHEADLLAEQGNLTEAIVAARALTLTSNKKLPDTVDVIMNSIEETQGIESGIDDIDAKLGGWHRGNIISILGDVATYKTQVTLWIALQALRKNPQLTAVYFEKEMSTNDIGRRIMSIFAKISAYEVMEINNKGDSTAKELLKKRIQFALDKDEVKEILSRLTIIGAENFDNATDIFEYVDYHQFDIVAIDFLTMLGDSKGLNEKELYGFFMKQMQIIKAMTLSCNTITILINQLKKNSLASKMIKIPGKEDIEWGSQVNQYSAYMFATFYPVQLPRMDNQVPNSYYYLVCQKNRHGISNLNIPIYVDPQYFDFSNPLPHVRTEMLKWLNDYKKGKNLYASHIGEGKESPSSGDNGSAKLPKGLRPSSKP